MTVAKLTFLLVFTIGIAGGTDFCSLTVRVLSPDGKRPLEVPVSIQEQSGRRVVKETTSEDVRFCDLGILPVTVTVGNDSCNQVVVNEVPLGWLWESNYLVTIIYDPVSCMPEAPPAPEPICDILFRVSDQTENWVKKASIQFRQPETWTQETDQAGRVLITVKRGQQVTGRVEAPGYKVSKFGLFCSGKERIKEKHIELEPTGN